jgi:hypothetical protein
MNRQHMGIRQENPYIVKFVPQMDPSPSWPTVKVWATHSLRWKIDVLKEYV